MSPEDTNELGSDAVDEILAAMSAEDEQNTGKQASNEATKDVPPVLTTQDVQDADPPQESGGPSGELKGAAESIAQATDDTEQKQQEPEAAPPGGEETSFVQQDASSEIGDLLLDVDTGPASGSTSEELRPEEVAQRFQLESILTESLDGEAGQVESRASEEDERAGGVRVDPRAARPAPPHGATLLAGKAVWLVVGLFALNSVAVVGLGAMVFSWHSGQTDHLEQLIGVLREDLRARRAVAKEEGTDQFLLQVERAGELFNAAQYGLALPLLQKVSRALPGRPDLLWKAALSAVHLKRWREASELLQEFTSRFPDDQNFPAALMHLADSYSSLGLYGRARKSYYRLIALSGRLTDEQRALLPVAYGKVADCYRLEASMIEAARAHE